MWSPFFNGPAASHYNPDTDLKRGSTGGEVNSALEPFTQVQAEEKLRSMWSEISTLNQLGDRERHSWFRAYCDTIPYVSNDFRRTHRMTHIHALEACNVVEITYPFLRSWGLARPLEEEPLMWRVLEHLFL